ncbi:MAG TPA: DegT/DnrJ/EryC1/StrS family aminotransferase [Candidatus Udaeobacter sp.]|nr:DegT/DnrJ/EryC1/StrS family aminotransferase [Candidatus Udaeobacter sp.]
MNLAPTRTRVAGFDLKYSDAEVRSIMERFGELIRSGFISMGRNVAEFERQWSDYCGVKYAVGTANGTCSMEMILRAIPVQGGTVVVPSHTFIASAAAAIRAGARVIFVDCQRDNFQMDPEDLRRKIRPDTRAVMLVHMSGIISPHLDEIRDICNRHGVPLVEDAAHAHGATIDGSKAGSLGLAGSFSFFSTKVITTGEGGMITTDDEKVYKTACALRDHGRFGPEPNVHHEIGYNWRPSEFNALLGLEQMRRVDEILQRRRQIAREYDRKLKALKIPGIKLLEIPARVQSSYYKYILYLEPPLEREKLKQILKQEYGVSLPGELYNRNCHTQPVFDRYPEAVVPQPKESFPETEYVVSHHFCLPLYPSLQDEQVDDVVASLDKAVRSL